MTRASVLPADPEETTEMRLVRRWRSGDRRSGDRLLRRYMPVLQSFFARRVSANVEDLVQQTLSACVEAVERFEGRSSFKSYLLGIAHHQFLMSIRAQTTAGGESATLASRPDDTPSQLAAFREEQFLVVSALIKLEPEFLAVIKRFYWAQLSVEEIAAELRIPVGTVKSRLARGRAMLKQNLLSMNVRAELRDDALRELASWMSARGR